MWWFIAVILDGFLPEAAGIFSEEKAVPGEVLLMYEIFLLKRPLVTIFEYYHMFQAFLFFFSTFDLFFLVFLPLTHATLG